MRGECYLASADLVGAEGRPLGQAKHNLVKNMLESHALDANFYVE